MTTSKVILTDTVAETLVSLLIKERFQDKPTHFKGKSMPRQEIQNVLALLVLFDEIILPDFSNELKVKDINGGDFIKIIPQETLPMSLRGIQTGDEYESLFNAFDQAVDLVLQFRPLVLNRVVRDLDKSNLWALLAKSLKVTRQRICSDALDYIAVTQYRKNIPLEKNLIVNRVPEDIRVLIDRDLSSQDKSLVGHSVMLFLSFLLAAQQIQSFEGLMQQYQTGIASRKYTGLNALFEPSEKFMQDTCKLTESFHLLRYALHQEVAHFPYIENVNHAIRLRKDPNLQSYREQVKQLHNVLMKGEVDAVLQAQHDVQRAQQALKAAEIWSNHLNWVTYISLPISIIEMLLSGFPVVSLPLSIISVVRTWENERLKHKNNWIMFGH